MEAYKRIAPYSLALVTSISYATWAILALIIVNSNGVSFAVSLDTVYISFLAISWAMVIILRKGRNSFPLNMLKMSVLEGVFYSCGSLFLFYALTYSKAFPLTEAFSYSSIILFAVFVRNANKSKAGFRYFLSTILTFLGIAAIAFGVYGSGFALSTLYIASLLPLVIFYALAAYYTFKPMNLGYDPITFQAVTMTVQVAITSAVIASFGLLGQFYNLSPQAWAYAAVIAMVLVIGYLSELSAFKIVRRAKAKVINMINILTNLELVGVALFSIFFLSLNWLEIFAGATLLITGVVFLQRSDRVGGRKPSQIKML